MFAWIWVLVAIVAIVTSFILKFQRNQLLMADSGRRTNEEVTKLEAELKKLQHRIENLEAIAAADPDEFSQSGAGDFVADPEMEDEKEANQNTVRNIARKRKAGS